MLLCSLCHSLSISKLFSFNVLWLLVRLDAFITIILNYIPRCLAFLWVFSAEFSVVTLCDMWVNFWWLPCNHICYSYTLFRDVVTLCDFWVMIFVLLCNHTDHNHGDDTFHSGRSFYHLYLELGIVSSKVTVIGIWCSPFHLIYFHDRKYEKVILLLNLFDAPSWWRASTFLYVVTYWPLLINFCAEGLDFRFFWNCI